jgi:hypothetical protein
MLSYLEIARQALRQNDPPEQPASNKAAGIPPVDIWPESLRAMWAERAAIKEFDGGMPCAQAEEQARRETWELWQQWDQGHRWT